MRGGVALSKTPPEFKTVSRKFEAPIPFILKKDRGKIKSKLIQAKIFIEGTTQLKKGMACSKNIIKNFYLSPLLSAAGTDTHKKKF